MKFKKIMLVTLLLLAILTIGAVSAADNTASDDLAVSDDEDVVDVSQDDELGEMDENDVNIDVDEDVSKDDTSVNFTKVSVSEKDGNFVICTGEGEGTVELYREDLSESDRCTYDDVKEVHYLGVSLDDINGYIADKIDSNKNFYDLVVPNQIVRFVLEYQGDNLVSDAYSVDFNDENITFTPFDDSGENDGVFIDVAEGEFNLSDNEQLNAAFATIKVLNNLQGNITITCYDDTEDEDIYFFNKNLNDFIHFENDGDYDVYVLTLEDLNNLEDFKKQEMFTIALSTEDDELGDRDYKINYNEDENKISFDADDDEGDGEDDEIIIFVDDGEFNLSDDDQLNAPFATIKALNKLQGNITISVEDEDNEIYYFNKNLDDLIPSESDGDYNVYVITLNNLTNLYEFKNQGKFKIGLYTENGDYDHYDSRYKIIYNEEDNLISFEEDNPTEGEGEPLENIIFEDGNTVTDDAVVIIPKDNFPQVADEFDVILKIDDSETKITLNLSEIDSDDGNYYIKVSDLEINDIGEGNYIGILIQFYDDEGNGTYYAETDEEGIEIYSNPYIADSVNTYEDWPVVSFREIEGVDDNFTVTISKEGCEDVVKTFKISELNNTAEEEDEPAAYELRYSDLGITEVGKYGISVSFTKGGQPFINNAGNVTISNELEIWIEEGELGSIADSVFALRVSEEMKGYVKIYVDNLQVGDNTTFDKLFYMGWGPTRGRQVWLNNFNITQTGDYEFKVEVFDENGQFLNNATVSKHVEVGVNSAEFNDVWYGQGDFIKFTLTSPISQDGYFIIYLNGEKAGVFYGNVYEDVVLTNDKFVNTLGYGEYDRFLKVGNYDANITYFDGASESDFATGTISVKSMNITAKESYDVNDNVTISFKSDKPTKYSRLYVSLITGWGLMGPDDHVIVELGGDDVVKAWKDGAITLNIGKLDLGTNNLLIGYAYAENEDDWDNEDYILDASDLISVHVVTDPALTISIANITEGADAVIAITTNNTFSGTVLVQIGTSNYTVNVVNGSGTLPVSGLTAGTYNATAIFNAYDVFAASTKNTTFTVKPKVATEITAKAVITTYGTSKNIVISLTAADGTVLSNREVTIVLNGVTKTVKTDAKGQATYAISNKLAVKAYTATLTFAGDANYAKSTGTVKVTVNKAKPILTAKNKAFKVKKSKKYTVILKTDKKKAMKNAKVVLTGKFKGKKIKIIKKTNKKGKATFNLKKLTKKGKFKATIKFAGNSNYKAVSKKVKITIK